MIRTGMRSFLFALTFCFVLTASPGDAAPAKKGHSKAIAGPRNGVKTPGVQVPFSRLKAEASLDTPSKPAWIAFLRDSIYVPADGKLARVDPKTNKFSDPIAAILKPCGGMAFGFGSLWAESCGADLPIGGSLMKVDAKSGKITSTLKSGEADIAGSIATTDDSVWTLIDTRTTLARVDPDQMLIVGTIRLPESCRSLIAAEKSLWIACTDENKIYRINPDTNLVDKRIDVGPEPVSLAFGEGSVWAFCRKEGKVDRIDPKTNKVSKTIDLGAPGATGQIAVGENSVWVTMTGFPITRIDPKDESVAQQFWGAGGGAITVSPEAIWLSNLNDGTLWRLDPNLIKATLAE